MSVFDHSEFDEHERVVFWDDKKTGLKAIIAVHNTNLGPALGGCRMWPYASSSEALTDVLRLSKGMTYKAAIAELNLGGGKSVILGDPRKIKTPEMMASMGRFVDSLNGGYITAEDSGISVSDLHCMAKHSQFIGGINAQFGYDGQPTDGNPAPSTAYGVFVGLQAAVRHAFKQDVNGLTVAIQGLGHVGARLAKHLHEAGAKLIVADIFPENTKMAAQKYGATIVDADAMSGGARSGGIRVSFFASSRVCLSMYANILWVTAGSVMQAMIFTLRFSHASHWVISILNTLFNL